MFSQSLWARLCSVLQLLHLLHLGPLHLPAIQQYRSMNQVCRVWCAATSPCKGWGRITSLHCEANLTPFRTVVIIWRILLTGKFKALFYELRDLMCNRRNGSHRSWFLRESSRKYHTFFLVDTEEPSSHFKMRGLCKCASRRILGSDQEAFAWLLALTAICCRAETQEQSERDLHG